MFEDGAAHARLTTARSCQFESWVRLNHDSRELWALPACNPGGNLEFTIGAGYARHDDGRSTYDYVFQAKTLFRALETNGWGGGLGVGTIRHPEIDPGPNMLGSRYAYLPFSVSLLDDRVVVHANFGGLRDRATRRTNLTWGLAGEFQTGTRLMLLAETFGDNRDNPYWQVGARYAVLPDRIQIDATVGQQFSGPGSGRWGSRSAFGSRRKRCFRAEAARRRHSVARARNGFDSR